MEAPVGLEDGHLKACPSTPNCVSTLSSDPEHSFPKIELTDPDSALNRFAVVSEALGGKIAKREVGYVHLEFRSALMGFVDDVEFHLDPVSRSLEARSASRVGRSDLGANRTRLTKLVEAFKAQK